MLDHQEGLIVTYNCFHDPAETAQDIAHLRRLHVEMDHTVTPPYGWQGPDLGHGFHETARRELLTRLLHRNQERYAIEVRLGLHEKKSVQRDQRGKEKEGS